MPAVDLTDLLPTLPRLLTRKDIGTYFKNIISPRYLANLDGKGAGPVKTYIGRKVAYRREDFIEWLQSRQKDSWNDNFEDN